MLKAASTRLVSGSVCEQFFSIVTQWWHIRDGCSEADGCEGHRGCLSSLTVWEVQKNRARICRGVSRHTHLSLGLIIRIPGMALLRNTLTHTHTHESVMEHPLSLSAFSQKLSVRDVSHVKQQMSSFVYKSKLFSPVVLHSFWETENSAVWLCVTSLLVWFFKRQIKHTKDTYIRYM